ncbi:MAG: hypothetical protein ACI970_001339 [Myxococcota bacterium]|jgi:hypothetical protein
MTEAALDFGRRLRASAFEQGIVSESCRLLHLAVNAIDTAKERADAAP